MIEKQEPPETIWALFHECPVRPNGDPEHDDPTKPVRMDCPLVVVSEEDLKEYGGDDDGWGNLTARYRLEEVIERKAPAKVFATESEENESETRFLMEAAKGLTMVELDRACNELVTNARNTVEAVGVALPGDQEWSTFGLDEKLFLARRIFAWCAERLSGKEKGWSRMPGFYARERGLIPEPKEPK